MKGKPMEQFTRRGACTYKRAGVTEDGIYVENQYGGETFYNRYSGIYPAIEKLAKVEDLQENCQLLILPRALSPTTEEETE